MTITIEKLKEQLNQCIAQRDQYAAGYQQTVGAITLLQEQIKTMMVDEALSKKSAELAEAEAKKAAAENQGDDNAVKEGNE
jgi:hypothetical protein